MEYDLVFEGGGAKGMVFVGAYETFLKRGHSFVRLLGTSAGAITATLLAVGYTPAEMLEALAEKKDGRSVFCGFMGKPPSFTDEEIRTSVIRNLLGKIDFKFLSDWWEKKLDDRLASAIVKNEHFRHVVALIERGGWFAADQFVVWFREKLDLGSWNNRRRAFSGMTLAQLYEATGVELSVVASDTTDQKILVLNHHTAPDCPIVWAVRMSMSIPLVWDEIIWQPGWGHYRGCEVAGHAIVDGGLISNFPIELFISDKPEIIKLMGSKKENPVLGMLIDEHLPVNEASEKGILIDIHVTPTELSTVQRLQRLVDAATSAHDKMVIEEYKHLVARLPAAGCGTTEFDMSDAKRNALVEAGRRAMALYLEKPMQLSPSAKGISLNPMVADRIALRIFE
jgi:predicted acylesterase/phospholipase RssA